MIKPIGCYGVTPGDYTAPSWVRFSEIAEWDYAQFATAAAHSRATGLKWVLNLGHVPLDVWAPITRKRLAESGLWEHVAAVIFGEEWYSRAMNGEYDTWLPGVAGVPMSTTEDGKTQQRLSCMQAWIDAKYAQVKMWYPEWPLLWVENWYWPDASLGWHVFRPCPAHADVLGLSYYRDSPPLEVVVSVAEDRQARPLLLIPQCFEEPGYLPMSDAMLARYRTLLARPRVLGALAYVWELPQASTVARGLKDLPQWHSRVAAALGA